MRVKIANGLLLLLNENAAVMRSRNGLNFAESLTVGASNSE